MANNKTHPPKRSVRITADDADPESANHMMDKGSSTDENYQKMKNEGRTVNPEVLRSDEDKFSHEELRKQDQRMKEVADNPKAAKRDGVVERS
jgi:hypothetical protein